MTKIILATTAILFAASIQAADSRQAFVMGNPDSDNSGAHYQGVTAVQPGVGADLNRYQGVADDNPDLFAVDLGMSPATDLPDIYGPFGNSPDLSY
ncbi:MAG: hypothetical protein WBM40_12680 [Thiohalocapsa sp.]